MKSSHPRIHEVEGVRATRPALRANAAAGTVDAEVERALAALSEHEGPKERTAVRRDMLHDEPFGAGQTDLDGVPGPRTLERIAVAIDGELRKIGPQRRPGLYLVPPDPGRAPGSPPEAPAPATDPAEASRPASAPPPPAPLSAVRAWLIAVGAFAASVALAALGTPGWQLQGWLPAPPASSSASPPAAPLAEPPAAGPAASAVAEKQRPATRSPRASAPPPVSLPAPIPPAQPPASAAPIPLTGPVFGEE